MVHVPIISDFYDYEEEKQQQNDSENTFPSTNRDTVKKHASDYTNGSASGNKYSTEEGNSDIVIVSGSFHANNTEV